MSPMSQMKAELWRHWPFYFLKWEGNHVYDGPGTTVFNQILIIFRMFLYLLKQLFMAL